MACDGDWIASDDSIRPGGSPALRFGGVSNASASDITCPSIAVIDADIVMRLGRGNTANIVASINSVAEALRVTSAHRGAGTTNHEPITMHRVRMAAVLMSRPIRLSWLGVYARNTHSLP